MTAEGEHDWKFTKDKLWKCQICGRITFWKAALKNKCPGPKEGREI